MFERMRRNYRRLRSTLHWTVTMFKARWAWSRMDSDRRELFLIDIQPRNMFTGNRIPYPKAFFGISRYDLLVALGKARRTTPINTVVKATVMPAVVKAMFSPSPIHTYLENAGQKEGT